MLFLLSAFIYNINLVLDISTINQGEVKCTSPFIYIYYGHIICAKWCTKEIFLSILTPYLCITSTKLRRKTCFLFLVLYSV